MNLDVFIELCDSCFEMLIMQSKDEHVTNAIAQSSSIINK